ncbi:M48 family metalloprotease [Leisingera aquaemixtae]|uniref:M48 family metalloprotease n=1 Tax=Leisingera aquaemixtae TaxID=1396826 RepID=UPI001C954EA9|nr:M48 family metalloprotease [Leisingera aquaemixtae]MBY6066819.1 M48 family metalloprotease [Leisingera aquaemixtae]
MRRFLCLFALAASACNMVVEPASQPVPAAQRQPVQGMAPGEARSAFATVSRRVEPVAERECRKRTQGLNCDFLIRIDPNPKAAPNAYQSLDRNGRPVITFTQRMLGQIANHDELAFVMSHEAAHHIRGHLARQATNSALVSAGAGLITALAGGGSASVSTAQDIGGFVGARTYSKDFELEADELGTIITHKSGYRPSVGVRFFNRLPDPGDRFLGTHPANPDRVRVVQATIARNGLN